jgi:hypothetical protein
MTKWQPTADQRTAIIAALVRYFRHEAAFDTLRHARTLH